MSVPREHVVLEVVKQDNYIRFLCGSWSSFGLGSHFMTLIQGGRFLKKLTFRNIEEYPYKEEV